MALKFAIVNAIPGSPAANTLYFVKDGATHYRGVLTDNAGALKEAYADPKSVTFTHYSLPIATSTGALNLAQNNIFKIDTSTTGVRNVSFTNPPAEAMVIVIETVGNLGTISFPGTVTVAAGVDPTQGTIKSIFTLLWDTERYYLVSNAQVS